MAIKIHTSPGFLNKKDILIRHAIIFLMACFFAMVSRWNNSGGTWWLQFIANFINIAIIWNGNLLLLEIFDRNISFEKEIKTKLLTSIIIALIWPTIVHVAANAIIYPYIIGKHCDLTSLENISYLIISVVLTLFVNSVFFSLALFKYWRNSIKEKEELKRERLIAEFAALKNQINPHFLFNSLNTLTSLIDDNPKQANIFLQKLSSVYRHLLAQGNKELITLKEELPFIESYIYLNKIRYGNNLQTHVHVDSNLIEKKVASLAIQMLVENAIKHNVISQKSPLTIYVGVNNNKLVVRNTLQPKNITADNNGIGLNNIINRYSFLSTEQVEIINDGKDFVVSLPLL